MNRVLDGGQAEGLTIAAWIECKIKKAGSMDKAVGIRKMINAKVQEKEAPNLIKTIKTVNL